MLTSPEETPETAHPAVGKVTLWFLQPRRSPQAQEHAFLQAGSHRVPRVWPVQPAMPPRRKGKGRSGRGSRENGPPHAPPHAEPHLAPKPVSAGC